MSVPTELDDALTTALTDSAPPVLIGPDPVVAEIVRREVSQIGRVRQHLPPNFDELPMPVRNRLYSQVEAALLPEPDLGWIEGDEFLEPPRETEWLITDLITAAGDGGRVLVAGPEKSFKSLFAAGCMVAIASGEPLFGYAPWSVPEPGPVLAFMGEGGREWNRSRVVRMMEGLGFDDATKRSTAKRIRMATVPLTPPERFALKLEEQLESRNWKLVVVDSLYVFGGTTERSQLAAMGTLLVKWAELAERSGTTLMVVDHFRKATTALELASVSGVGASQWAQAWALMKAKYDSKTDTTVMTVKTGARQSPGGTYRVNITGVMDGPIRVGAETTLPSDSEDDDGTDMETLKSEKLWELNRYCADNGEWVRMSMLKTDVLKTGDTEVVDYILDQPHVVVCASKSGKQKWVFALGHDGTLPPDLPKNAEKIIKEGSAPEPEPTVVDEEGED